jgi:hypothetical protein
VSGRLGAGSLRWMAILIRPVKPFGFAMLTGSEIRSFACRASPTQRW